MKPDASRPIVALRSNDYCFLGALRGLAAAGLDAVPVVFDWPGAGPWYSERSRHFAAPHRIPNPHQYGEDAARAFAQVGDDLARRHGDRPIVIPSSDTNIVFMLDHWKRLAHSFRVLGDANFDANRIEIVRKDLVAPILEAGGVAAPVTRPCRTLADIDEAVDDVPLPCVYKPASKDTGQTFYARHDGLKAVSCDDRDELRRRLRAEIEDGFDLVVQERIPFDSAAEEIPFYAYIDGQHRIRMAATGIKEKIQPHPFGTATVLRLGWHPELLPLAEQVAKATRWRGILMIEFIRDPRDGRWKVIELNCRPWLAIDFYRRCGLNYFQALADDLAGRFAADADGIVTPDAALLERSPVHFLLGSILDDWVADHGAPPTAETLGAWLRSIPGARSFSLLDPDDPEPGVAELRDRAQNLGQGRDTLLAEIMPLASH